MADDRFIASEVNADVRQDNLYKTLKRYRFVIAAVVVGAIGFVGYASWRSQSDKSAAIAQFQTLDALLQDPQDIAAREKLDPQSSALSALEAALIARQEGDLATARADYELIANDTKNIRAMRDFARLQIFSYDESAQSDLANPGSPFLVQAKLIEANNLIAKGQTEDALIVLEALLANREVQSERAFIETLVLALGGQIPDNNEINLSKINSVTSAESSEESTSE